MALYIEGCTEQERLAFSLIRETFAVKYPDLIVRDIQGDDETALFIQKHLGDMVWFNRDPTKHSGVSFAEVKAESKFTGNLFIETWSNWADEPNRVNPGWVTKIMGHWLFYVFLDRRILYMLPRTPLLSFFWMKHGEYPEKTQKKTTQRNITRGILVPVADVEGHLNATNTKYHIIELTGGKS